MQEDISVEYLPTRFPIELEYMVNKLKTCLVCGREAQVKIPLEHVLGDVL